MLSSCRTIHTEMAAVRDYLALTKPRIGIAVLLTTFTSMVLASGGQLPPAGPIWQTLLGTLLAVAGGAALNSYLEKDIDARMERTKDRPLPEGRIEPRRALVFSLSLSIISLAFLALTVNALTSALAALAIISYAVVYTLMKRTTTANTLIGAIPGAFPVLIGWAAELGQLTSGVWVPFGILFLWQPPHFLALSLTLKDDYARAGLLMLPVVRGDETTLRYILLYSAALFPASLAPYFLNMAGKIYFAAAAILSGALLLYAAAGMRRPTPVWARRFFYSSIFYLVTIFAALMFDAA